MYIRVPFHFDVTVATVLERCTARGAAPYGDGRTGCSAGTHPYERSGEIALDTSRTPRL